MKNKATKPELPKKRYGGIKVEIKKHPFIIPPAILHQLNEVTNGGFYLIAFSEEGFPVVFNRADNPVFKRALTDFCVDYFRSIGCCQEEIMQNNIMHQITSGTMEGLEDGDEGDAMGIIN